MNNNDESQKKMICLYKNHQQINVATNNFQIFINILSLTTQLNAFDMTYIFQYFLSIIDQYESLKINLYETITFKHSITEHTTKTQRLSK